MSKVTVQEYEMLDFFGKEPKMLDQGVPWVYNSLTYDLRIGRSMLIFKIAPSYKHLEMQIKCGEQIVYDFKGDIEDVLFDEKNKNLRIHINKVTELILTTKPAIKISHSEPTK